MSVHVQGKADAAVRCARLAYGIERRGHVMLNQFSRTQLIFGAEGMERLYRARVAVFGIGGVGGYTVEGWRAAASARSISSTTTASA